MAATYVSCPCCGTTVRPPALNLDEDGNRVAEEEIRRYGCFVKTRHMLGDRNIQWTSRDAPLHVLRAVREQMAAALADVDTMIAAAD
jgi:hypothetical protein